MTFISYTMTLFVNDGGTGASSGTSTQLSKVRSISKFPFGEVNWIRTPYLDQSSRLVPYTAGLTEPGDFTCQIEYDHATLTRLQGLQGVSHIWKVGFVQDSYNATFTGTLGMLEVVPGGPEEVTSIDITIKVQSAVTVATGVLSMAMYLSPEQLADPNLLRGNALSEPKENWIKK